MTCAREASMASVRAAVDGGEGGRLPSRMMVSECSPARPFAVLLSSIGIDSPLSLSLGLQAGQTPNEHKSYLG